MFSHIKCLISNVINEINKTPCRKCENYLDGYCLNSMEKYAECCGWKNKNYKEKSKF